MLGIKVAEGKTEFIVLSFWRID